MRFGDELASGSSDICLAERFQGVWQIGLEFDLHVGGFAGLIVVAGTSQREHRLILLRESDAQSAQLKFLEFGGSTFGIEFDGEIRDGVAAEIRRQSLNVRSRIEVQEFARLFRDQLQIESDSARRSNVADEWFPIRQIQPGDGEVERGIAR